MFLAEPSTAAAPIRRRREGGIAFAEAYARRTRCRRRERRLGRVSAVPAGAGTAKAGTCLLHHRRRSARCPGGE
ncbi:hypothetical protein MTO96_042072 [Rhipicephalus appendiculatus]